MPTLTHKEASGSVLHSGHVSWHLAASWQHCDDPCKEARIRDSTSAEFEAIENRALKAAVDLVEASKLPNDNFAHGSPWPLVEPLRAARLSSVQRRGQRGWSNFLAAQIRLFSPSVNDVKRDEGERRRSKMTSNSLRRGIPPFREKPD